MFVGPQTHISHRKLDKLEHLSKTELEINRRRASQSTSERFLWQTVQTTKFQIDSNKPQTNSTFWRFCGGKIQSRTTNCLNSKSSLKIFKESQIKTIDAVLASTQGVCALPHWGSERITWTVWWESNSLCKSLLLDSLFFKVRVSFLF